MIRPTRVEARRAHHIFLEFSDGTSGEVDLSHLADKGVFAAWNAPGCFESVHLGEGGSIAWGDDIELCPDAMYLQLTGMAVEDYMPGVRSLTGNA